MEDDSTEMAVVPRKKTSNVLEHNYAPCFKVVLPDKSFVMVPMDKVSSDAKRSILVAKARDFVAKHLDRLMDAGLTPAEVKDLVKAVSDVDALQREQHVTSLNNSSSELGRGVEAIVRGAAKGAAEGTADAFMDKFKKMDAAAKKVDKKVEAITV